MASFRKRNNLWQAQVRSKYIGSISKSFHSKLDAQKWAKEQEVLMQCGQWSGVGLPIDRSPWNTDQGSMMGLK